MVGTLEWLVDDLHLVGIEHLVCGRARQREIAIDVGVRDVDHRGYELIDGTSAIHDAGRIRASRLSHRVEIEPIHVDADDVRANAWFAPGVVSALNSGKVLAHHFLNVAYVRVALSGVTVRNHHCHGQPGRVGSLPILRMHESAFD